jgi:phage-related protein
VTHGEAIDIKQVVFIGGARGDFDELPGEIKEEAVNLLSDLQNGRIPANDRYKRLTGDKSLDGIGKIRLNGEDGNTYRVYNVITFREVVYVIDAGAKKSPRGGAIPDVDKGRLRARKARAEDDYRDYRAEYEQRFEARQKRREKLFSIRALSRRPKGV